jgi:hypothetical protein
MDQRDPQFRNRNAFIGCHIKDIPIHRPDGGSELFRYYFQICETFLDVQFRVTKIKVLKFLKGEKLVSAMSASASNHKVKGLVPHDGGDEGAALGITITF